MKLEKQYNRRSFIVTIVSSVLVTLLLFLFSQGYTENVGSDDRALEAISEIDRNYIPWFQPVFEPGNRENILFACQAVIGAVVIGCCIGVLRRRKVGRNS